MACIDLDDLFGGAFAILRWVLSLLVRLAGLLYWVGPTPQEAYEPGSYGARSAAGRSYRVLWRVGQLIFWSVLILIVGIVVWLVYFRR